MRSGAAVLDRQAGIQQQYALPRPAFQIAVTRVGDAEICGQFLVDVLQRGRRGNTMRHRKAQPVRLSGAVIGVLPQDHHLHLVEWCQFEGTENLASRRVDPFASGLFGPQEIAEPGHMRRGKLGSEPRFPARLDPDVMLLCCVVRHVAELTRRYPSRQPVRQHRRRRPRSAAGLPRSAPDADRASPPA